VSLGRATILVPLDGSAGSEAVLAAVERLARKERAMVRLLHVAAPAGTVTVDGRVVRYADQEIARIGHEARSYLTSVAAALTGVEVDLVVRFGDPVEEIVREATPEKVNLVAMASRHRTGLRRLLERSVAGRVKRETRVPVLLVRHGDRLAV
jgi:nucleotide-binding universal stress UspA family protein